MRKTVLILWLSLVVPCSVAAGSLQVISIGNQQEFDTLQERIERAVYSGVTDISVVLAPGTYLFSDYHLKIYGKDWGGVNLTISGDGCTITASGVDFRNGDPWSGAWDPGWLFLHPRGGRIDSFGPAVQSPGTVKVVDEGRRLCKVRLPDRTALPDGPVQDGYIQLTRWYEARTCKVTQIRDGWVYFIAEDLERVSPLGYNVNYDFLYGRKMPRFRLGNVGAETTVTLDGGRIRLPDGVGAAHCCMASTFLNIHNSAIGSITLAGLEFRGNAAVELRSLIGVYQCRCGSFTVRDCTFSDIRSPLFSAEYTDHIRFTGNSFEDCDRHVISTSATCRNARIQDNRFNRCGCEWGPWACITVCGDDYVVSGNRICDFGYVGIFVGCIESGLAGTEPGGIVEDNTLWYDPDFLADSLSHTMMDSGAIYISTCNDIATVRRNYIHDIGGYKDNRGIFCDDGARNFDIHDNVILNIANSYSIDSRRVPEGEGARIPHNVGNRIHGNLVNAPIRFEGNEKGDRCSLGTNYRLPDAAGGSFPGIRVRNISQTKEQRIITSIQGTGWEARVK